MTCVASMKTAIAPEDIPPRPDLSFERRLWAAGCLTVGGVDEAGRGAWAGPVAAAAVVFPSDESLFTRLVGVRDSKEMTAEQRTAWAALIRAACLAWGVGFASHAEIDALGIVAATRLAMQRAVSGLAVSPEHLLVDYLELPDIPVAQTALVKGDARSLSVAAASVLAKTARDALLEKLDLEYPGYGFARHKGYGTAEHRLALERLGPCPIHRLSYAPVGETVQCPAMTKTS